jgi:YhcH/YjgK/YiaL family protein
VILDTLNNAKLYNGVNPLFEAAFTFIARAVKENLPEGRYELQGSDLYAMVQVYPIDSDNPNVEFHNKYIDVQYIVEGCEHMGWADRADGPADAKYSAEYDIGLFPMETTADFDVKAGSYAVFFPGDLHKPKMLAGSSETVKKIVVKVKA